MPFDDGVKTVSGSIAHTDDAATKVPFVSVKCGIEPTLTGKSAIECTQTGRNLINANDESKTFSANVITNYDVASLELKKGVTYTFSAYQNTAITGSIRNTLRILFDGNNKYESIASNYHNQAGVHSMSITPTQDGKAVFAIWVHTSNEDITYSQFMVEYGSTATTYEPYTAPTHYTADLGRTIYGGTADIVNGVGKENCKKIALGDLTWIKSGTEGNFYCSQVTDIWYPSEGGISRYGIGVSDEFGFVQGAPTDGQINCYFNTAYSGYRIFIKKEDYADRTSAEFKEYLQSIDAHLVYKVNEATETDFTFTPITPTPETVGKVNNVYCDTGDTELTYHDNAHGFASVTVTKQAPDQADEVKTAYLHKVIYGGQADVVRGTCEPKNLVDFLSNIEPTYSGFTITVTSDYGINFNGTGTRTWAHLTKTIPCDFDAGTKLVFSIQEDKDYNIYVLFTYEDSSTKQFTIESIRVMDSVAFTLAKKAVSVRLDVALLQASTEYNETLYCMIEKGTTKTDFAPYFAPFTFPPISMETDEGENTLFATEGDSAITYRKAVD